jgi:hypothetical protein
MQHQDSTQLQQQQQRQGTAQQRLPPERRRQRCAALSCKHSSWLSHNTCHSISSRLR